MTMGRSANTPGDGTEEKAIDTWNAVDASLTVNGATLESR